MGGLPSLYGKENIESIKNEILIKAYESVKNENSLLQRSISVFGNLSQIIPSVSVLGIKFNSHSVGAFFTDKKVNQAKEFLLDGGIICFDDFERKSEKIHLNDLFGLITNLSLEMKCKIIVILNSDIFEGKDAIIFRNVKEKTVDKFFYFLPSAEQLFQSVFDEKKYSNIIIYKNDILSYIKQTNELNARFYIQALENCTEWISKGYSPDALKVLIFTSIFFSKHHFTFAYRVEGDSKIYSVVDYFLHKGFYEIAIFLIRTAPQLFAKEKPVPLDETIQILMSHINKKKEDKTQYSEDYAQRQNEEVEKNKYLIKDFIQYVYFFKIDEDIDSETYIRINDYIQNGILLKDNRCQPTSA